MKPLSEQLEVVAKAPGICVHPGYVEILRRAIALAKRYEDAPIVRVGGADGLSCSCFIERQGKKRLQDMQGQRVRIVLDKEG